MVHVLLISTSIVGRMLQLLELPDLICQPKVCTNLEVTMLYTQVQVMVLPFVTV